jgi:hypothetical protein
MLRYPNVRNAYANNLEFYQTEPEQYFGQIAFIAKMERFFRWHVSGDIPDYNYFKHMVQVADICAETQFLVFTKKYEIVNRYVREFGYIPRNLSIVFSVWDGLEMFNENDFPVAKVISKEYAQELGNDYHICCGNCATCAVDGTIGCWWLQNGDYIYLVEH